ncbi:phosphatidylinositol phosphatase PTPRQ-like isoform X2 [Oculina patagonica]
MQVDSSSCLFDPSNCPSGLSMGMFISFRSRGKSRTINGTQMFFGNSQGIDLRQGVTIYFNESSGRLNVAVFGSTNYCFRTVGLVRNSWTYLHLTWKSIGELNLYMEHHTSSNGYLTCGPITTPLPTNTTYSLGHVAFPTVHIDNLAIWFRDKQPFNAPWTYITDFGGNTTLSLTITLWDKPWDSALSNTGSTEFQSLQNDFISQISSLYGNNNTLGQTEVQQFTQEITSGGINAHVSLQFIKRTSWTDSITLQKSLESEMFLGGSKASITDCTADDSFFCEGLDTVTNVTSEGVSKLDIYFNHVAGINHHQHLMGYTVLHRLTDIDDTWKANDIRGGHSRKYTITGLTAYKNYSVRTMPYSFQAAGLIGPIIVLETKEDVPSSGPSILEAYSINSTSVFVRWNESSIPEEDWNGIPRGFRVHGQGSPCKGFHVTAQDVALNVSSFVVTGLKAWVKYIVKISGVTTPGHGTASEVVIKTHDSVPSQGPHNIMITKTSNHSVKVTWENVKWCHVHGPVVSYEVHFRDVEGGSTDLMHNVTVLEGEQKRLDFTDLEIYWKYGVRIKAFTVKGTGPLSPEITGRTDEWIPIVAPSSVNAFDPQTTSVRLSWYFKNNVRDVLGILTGFRIFYQLANSSSAPIQKHNVGANARQANIIGLDIYRFYKISVAAKTRINHGEISGDVYMRTLGTAPLHHPVPIKMSNMSSTSLHVAWGEVPDAYHHGEVMGYRVFLEETGHSGLIVASGSFPLHVNSTDFTGLKKFTSYTARVRAYSLFGEGPDGMVTTLTDEDIPSQSPADLELFNTSSTTLKAVWARVLDCCRHGIIRGYRLFLRDINTGEFVANETTPAGQYEFEFSSLLKFYGYSVSILAFTIKGDGPLSEVSAMTDEDVPIGAPFDVTGSNTSAWSLQITWDFDPNVRHVLGILLGFRVHYLNVNDSGAFWEAKTLWDPLARETILTGLEEYRDYNITITAFTRIGEGARSLSIVIRTDEHVPRAPPSDVIATNTSSTSLQVNWDKVPFPDQLGIIRGYRVLMWRTNQSAVILRNVTLLVPSRDISFTGLEKYTNYTIQVLAFTVKGNGNRSQPIVVITDEDVPTRRPAGIAAWNTSSTSIMLSWQPLADPYYLHGILRGYAVTYNRVDGLLPAVQINTSSSTLSLELGGLDEYVEYRFEVRAFTIKGAGPFTYINCLTDQDVPAAPPQNVSGYNISKHDIRVFWEEVPSRDVNGILLGYRVFFNETSDDVFNQTVEFPRMNVTLGFLRPYTFYTIQLLAFTIKGDGPKSPPNTIRTEEEAPQVYPWNVTGLNSSSTSIYLYWSAIPPELVAGVLREYRIVYNELNDRNETVKTHLLRLPVDQLSVNLTDLAKYTNYSFELQGISKFFGVQSPPIVVITDQDVPSRAPGNITSTNTSSTSLLITWEHIPKKLVHGILLGYRVFYHQFVDEQQIEAKRRRRAIDNMNETVETLPPNTTFLRISNLKKFTNYSFRIVGFTIKGEGKISQTFNVSTDEDVPSQPPVGPYAVNLSGPHIIHVSWEPVPEGFVHGILLGYRIFYTVISIAGEDVRRPTLNTTTDETALSTTLSGLLSYAVYEIRVTAFTVKGDGAISHSIRAETCRCPVKMTTNWYSFPPYMSRNQESSYEGIFPFILNKATSTCCTPCLNGHGPTSIDYEHDREGMAAEKDNVSLVHKNEFKADMTFPVEGYKGQTRYGVYRYVPLMESAGVALVAPLPSAEEKANFVIHVGMACFPMLLLTVLMVLLAGAVLWALLW